MLGTAPLSLRFNEYVLDESNALLTRDGQPVSLAPKAFAVLCALARQPGQLITKNALLDAVWGHQHVSESVLKTIVSDLREALADSAKQPRYIETASRRGYRFIANISNRTQAEIAAAPISASPNSVDLPVIIGRDQALAELHQAWRDAGEGRRQIIWVAGEAGIGKTTLIDRFVQELGEVRRGHGQCVEQVGIGEPYLPVLEALSSLCDSYPGLIPMLRAVAPRWMIQLPWLNSDEERESLKKDLADATQDRMLREMAMLLERYSREQPLLLVTEDLHWSDESTLRLMDHLARRRAPGRFMWLASFRLAQIISEDHPLKALRNELRLHHLCREILLDPFSEREVADYVEHVIPGQSVSEEFVRTLHGHTDGLPLFVANVVNDWISQGDVLAAADASTSRLHVPESLAGVIERQIQRLNPEQRSVLETASVCGVEFRRTTVAEMLGNNPAEVGEQCEELVRRQQWLRQVSVVRLPDGSLDARYAFRHAVYRHVFYQRLGALARVKLHGLAAVSMERGRTQGVEVTSAELALQFEMAQQPMAALRHYAEAANQALGRFAPTEAIGLTDRALALLPQCPEGVERLELEMTVVSPRGVACSTKFGVASPLALEAFQRAEEISELLPPAPERAIELSGLSWVHYTRGDFDATITLAKRILALGESRNDPILRLVACNLIGCAVCYQGHMADAVRWMDEGLSLCDEVGDKLATIPFVIDPGVSMHANLAVPLVQMGLPDQARAHGAAALARAKALRQPVAQMLAYWCLCILEARVGTSEHLLELAAELGRTVAAHGVAQGEGPTLWMQGIATARMGEADKGHALILEGYQRHARFEMLCGGTEVLSYAAEALILARRWDEAQKQIDEGLELANRINERPFVPELHLLTARVALGKRRANMAAEAIRTALREARAQNALGQEINALVALCELPDAAAEDRDALKHCLGKLTEGLDHARIKKARKLLATTSV